MDVDLEQVSGVHYRGRSHQQSGRESVHLIELKFAEVLVGSFKHGLLIAIVELESIEGGCAEERVHSELKAA